MARNMSLISTLAVGLSLAASPLASATSSEQASTPSLGADMMEMAMCGERNAVVAELAQQFSETPMAVGQVDGNSVVEILVSQDGTWTILATGTDGKSCVVSAGEGFESTTLIAGQDI